MSDRQRRYREANQRGGLVQVTVWVPADRADELRVYAAALCGQATPARVRRAALDPAQLGLDGLTPDRPAPEAPAHQRDAERGRPQDGAGQPSDGGGSGRRGRRT